MGQGHSRVTIYINFVELESQMLQAKFQDHRTSGSGEDFQSFVESGPSVPEKKNFQRFLPYMGVAAILVM